MPSFKYFKTKPTDLTENFRGYTYILDCYAYGCRAFITRGGVLHYTQWRRSQVLAEAWAQSYINERAIAQR